MNPAIFIPARMQSVRLPGKPLVEIGGMPMIVHVMRRAEEANIGPVYVACAEQEIADIVSEEGGRAILTSADHPSGTDRIFEALQQIDDVGHHDIIINLQGDLPTLDPAIIQKTLLPLEEEETMIATPVAEITDPQERDDPGVVKAVVAWGENNTGRALYFTRATAPYGDGPLYHHIGLYAYRRNALEQFVGLKQGALEKREKLEQLRAIEAGMPIGVVCVDTVPLGVDTQEDLDKARILIEAYNH